MEEPREEWILLLLLLYLLGRLGRRQISNYLGIGEGKVKRIIKELSEMNLIDTKRGGEALSRDGLEYLRNYFSLNNIFSVSLFDTREICEDCEGIGFLLRNASLSRILDIRDEAVRGGADGALIIRVEEGKLILPPDLGTVGKYFPRLENQLISIFSVLDGDIIILSYSRRFSGALIGGLKAAIAASRI